MRRILVGTIITLLGLTAALGWITPTVTQAAPSAAFGSDTITGTLVATPQSTLPATLLIQSGDRTVSVVVTANTQVEDSTGDALSLSLLSDGDNLRVTTIADRQGGRGRGQSTAVDATVVQDLSKPISPAQPVSPTSLVVTGTLAGEFTNGLCLQNANVTSSGISPSAVMANPCPSGDLPVYLANGATIENAAGTVITITSLLLNDSLQATGTVTNGQFSATTVQDLTQASAPVPTTYQLVVTGTLAAEFTNGLCLQNTSVTNGAVSPAAVTASPCPSGDLPVYLAAGATFENAGGTAIVLNSLLLNDSLQATGTVSNGQFSATTVQDLSQTVVNNSSNPNTNNNKANQNTLTTLVGTIQTCHFSGRNPYFTVKVKQGALKGVFTIYLQSNTQILGKRSNRAKTNSLHAGEVVTVQGMYNRHNHRWNTTQRVSIHA